MGAGQFIPGPHYESSILGSRAVSKGAQDIAEKVAERYRDGVGVDESDLRDSIEARIVDGPDGPEAVVVAEDWKARLHEFGTSRVKPNGALRSAVDSLGLKLRVVAKGNRVSARG